MAPAIYLVQSESMDLLYKKISEIGGGGKEISNGIILVVNTKIDNSLIFLESIFFKKSSTIIIIIFLVLPKNEIFSFTVESPDYFSIIV